MTSPSTSVSPISTALIPYDPTLLHISVDSVTRRAASIYKKSLENSYLSTYKALHLCGKETLESRMVKSVVSSCPAHSQEEIAQRLSNYDKASEHLTRLSDAEITHLLSSATPLCPDTGKEVFSVEVEGVPVFIKKIRLTPIEQQHPNSTANLFNLPTHYQYGVGSMGFGVWREIAAHKMTTHWVLNGECRNFPLMYHFRVLPHSPISEMLTEEDLQRDFVKWEGSSAVQARVTAANTAEARVVVFMESLPQQLDEWLSIEGSKGNLTDPAITNLERELNAVTAFMKSRGFLHFDAHFHNILAHNNHAYFADFGLSISDHFNLSAKERAFFEKHSNYDRHFVMAELAQRAIVAAVGREKSEAILDDYLSNRPMTVELPPAVASLAQRYRPIAILMNQFLQSLRESKNTPYPEFVL